MRGIFNDGDDQLGEVAVSVLCGWVGVWVGGGGWMEEDRSFFVVVYGWMGGWVVLPCDALDHFLVGDAEFLGVFASQQGRQDALYAVRMDDGT